METDKQSFQTVTALSEELHISRKTLYKRAKENNIALDGSYTSDELDILKGNSVALGKQTTGNSNSKQSNTSGKQKVTDDTQIIAELRKQISNLNNDKLFLQNELSSKNQAIKDANELANEAHKLADQAQQLHLDLQQKLNQSETEKQQLLQDNSSLNAELDQDKHKSFWSRLFGG